MYRSCNSPAAAAVVVLDDEDVSPTIAVTSSVSPMRTATPMPSVSRLSQS